MLTRNRAPLVPLFLVSLTAVGFEVALTRYFAIASWSEYGYWVISITMVGFAISGVILSVFRDFFVRQGQSLLSIMPLLLIAASVLGYLCVTVVPFNPLELQNPDQWSVQLANIGKYYAALFPFYFLAGLYVGLCFVVYPDAIPRSYAADLTGAGAGAVLVLLLMTWVHPFHLLAGLIPLLGLAGLYGVLRVGSRRRLAHSGMLILAVAGAEVLLGQYNRADFNEYKPIYAALHVHDSRIIEDIPSPRGQFLVLDNFTERLDVDLSNNFARLGAAGPPRTLGLYSDGNRLTSLPTVQDYDRSYLRAALDAFPYQLKRSPRVLLVGTRGGFRLREVLDLGAASVLATEPDPTVHELIRRYGKNPALDDPRVTLVGQSPAMLAVAPGWEGFDIIDLASDLLGEGDVNKYAFSVETMQAYLGLLREDGIVSIPVSIRELSVYALKALEAVRRALLANGVSHPEWNIMVYRSSWGVRILASRSPFQPEHIQQLTRFCNERSFDVSYFPGLDPRGLPVWNDLPRLDFREGTMASSDSPTDALRDDILQLLGQRGPDFLRSHFFDLEPPTHDRPFFYGIFRPTELGTVLRQIALVPREEIGALVNAAVLVQALVLALAVVAIPLVRWRRARLGIGLVTRSTFYFAALGLGFLFLEILLIEKAALLLGDRTQAFAMVLTSMLVFSGIGSYLSGAHMDRARRSVVVACCIIGAWILLSALFLDRLLLALLPSPMPLKALSMILIVAPLATALGFPFPLGLSSLGQANAPLLPWAWGLNGAFSVVATPLANLLCVSFGYTLLMLLSLLLYVLVLMSFPASRDRPVFLVTSGR